MPRRELDTLVVTLLLAIASGRRAEAQSEAEGSTMCPRSAVVPIAPPSTPLPDEDSSATVTRFSFIVYGDTRGPYDGRSLHPDHERVVESMLATTKARANGADAIRFVLHTGDAVTDGRVAAQWNASYNPLISRLTVGAELPFFQTVGNHDLSLLPLASVSERVPGLCNYLSANARLMPADGSPHRLRDYPSYGFGFGNTFFLAFDTSIADDTTQYSWVRRELARLDRRRYPNVVVFVHQPPISSGPHGGPRVEPASATLRSFFMPLFRQHHVRLVLSGHDHLFEHWVERYRDSSGTHRLDQIVTGGGGAPAYAYAGEPDLGEYLADAAAEQLKVEHLVRPMSTARQNPLHFVVVSVDGEQIRVEVVGVGPGRGFAPYGGRAATLLTDRN